MPIRPAATAPAFPPLAIGLVVLSWITLLVWDTSPYARYLNHGDWSAIGLGAAVCEKKKENMVFRVKSIKNNIIEN